MKGRPAKGRKAKSRTKAAKSTRGKSSKSKKASKSRKTSKPAAKRKTARKRAAPARKKATRKTASGKTASRRTGEARKRKEVFGEGNYAASPDFRRDQTQFVRRNKGKIPDMGEQAAAAREGGEGRELKQAEESARSHSAGEEG